MNQYKTKYIHLLLVDELKFIPRIVNLINDSKNNLCPENHTFITPYTKVYEALKHYPNVELDVSNDNLYTKYADRCDWIFSHGMIPKKQVLTTSKAVLGKVIYRYWGGSTVTSSYPSFNRPIKYIKSKLKRALFCRIYGSFAAIGVANVTDVLDLSRILKNTKFYRMPYPVSNGYEIIQNMKRRAPRNDGYVNVLLGHRGKHEDNHVQLIESLRKYENDKVRIYVPLSYGDEAYIEGIKKYISEKGWHNIIVITDFLEYCEYIEMLNDMDIAILDGTTSYALGNIAILLSLGKTIYINRNGIIKQAFDKLGLPCKCIDELERESFSQLATLIDYSPFEGNELEIHTFEFYVELWKNILSDFN